MLDKIAFVYPGFKMISQVENYIAHANKLELYVTFKLLAVIKCSGIAVRCSVRLGWPGCAIQRLNRGTLRLSANEAAMCTTVL